MNKPKTHWYYIFLDLVTQVSVKIKGPMEPIELERDLIDTGWIKTIVHKKVVSTALIEMQKEQGITECRVIHN